MKTDEHSIEDGRTIANDLAKLSIGPRWELERYQAEMTAQDQSDLAAYRRQQMASIIEGVENSEEGAVIREQVARQLYAEQFEAKLRAQMKAAAKV